MKSNYSPEQVMSLFIDIPKQWWIAGGWAIDLFLEKQTREHEDVDVAILRCDELTFRKHLEAWELWIGLGNGRLEDKSISTSQELPANREVLWCRPSAHSDWAFELLLNKNIDDEWIFKRDSSIRKPLKNIGTISSSGIPFLNPEIVLLFKAKNNLDKDQHDFEQVLPELSAEAKSWLADSLTIVHPRHAWIDRLQ